MATVNKDFRIKSGLVVESGSITTPLSTAGIVLTSGSGVLSSTATIANSYLANSAITFGSTSQALGSTISNIAGVTINSTTIPTSKTLVVTTDIGTTVQAYDADLGAIAALTGTSGFLKTNGSGTWSVDTATYLTTAVTSVGLSLPNIFTVSNSPVTTTGTLTATLASQTANQVFAAPNGSNGAPTFRALAKADIPGVNNSFVVKADSGTTEGTDLYTFDGSSAKTLNIVGGTNITITKSAGSWTIAGLATGVTSLSFGSTGLTPNTGTTGAVTVAGTLVAANGGTGISSYAIGDIIYASGSTTLAKLTAVATGNVLISGGVTTAPSWGKVGLATHVSGTLPLANGGTGTVDGSITGTGALTYTAGGTNTNINLVPNGTGTVDVASKRVTNVATPTSDYDAANKLYVDNAVNGLDWKASANLLAASNIALTGSTGTLVIDGHTALAAVNNGYRLLLIGQSTPIQNGLYTYSDAGSGYTLTRSTDADSHTELIGAAVFIMEGTGYGNTSWVQSNHYLSSFTGQSWVQFAGAGTYIAGAGLTSTGTTFNVGTASTARIVVNADNVDLATVSQTNTTGTAGINFVQSHTIDSYGRTTGTVSADIRNATSSLAGIALFPTAQFTVTSGSVALTSLAGSVINSGVVGATYGGTGVNNGSNTLTLAGNVSHAGAFTQTFTATGNTSVTLPTTGTLATLAGSESLTNKKLGSLTTNGLVTTSGSDGTLSVTTMGSGIATFLSTPTSANLASALTDETGSSTVVMSASPALTGTVTFGGNAAIVNASGSTTGTTVLTLSSVFATAAYDGGEFLVKIENGVNLQIIKVILVTNGTDFYVTQYADVQTSTSLATVDFSITTGNVNILVTPVAGATGTTSVKAMGNLIAS
jgi:hypothetical protein